MLEMGGEEEGMGSGKAMGSGEAKNPTCQTLGSLTVREGRRGNNFWHFGMRVLRGVE
ncbi:hypothetical protein C1H46_000802 [Malus baccata]|uniref:Uncharacterized protein n=1 Tax=Malus baccata TaxID=106549 RepID=A0A540NS06_MALBA|nr:hypothetical protein C1H46_000802 [Malus baccata]